MGNYWYGTTNTNENIENDTDLVSSLGNDLASEILEYLNPNDLARLSQVSKYWNSLIQKSPLWEGFFLRLWGERDYAYLKKIDRCNWRDEYYNRMGGYIQPPKSWQESLYSIFQSPTKSILVEGLDNSGKTTFLHFLRDRSISTSDFKSRVQVRLPDFNLTLELLELGVSMPARKIWREYAFDMDGFIYMIDGADPDRFEESKKELQSYLRDLNQMVPILILVNKQDSPRALSAYEVEDKMQLKRILGNRRYLMIGISLVKRIGYSHGLKWLAKHV